MQDQVLLAASSAGPNIAAWDIATGGHLASYKGGGCCTDGLALLGRDYLVAAQAAAPALHFWTWHKDALLQRCFAAEQLRCVAASADGALVAAGGASGRVYVWQAGGGRLLRSWPTHYRPVTALTFADGGRLLLSAGEDALAHAWLLMDVLDAELPADSPPSALHSWPAHTLAVTALWAGAGGANAFVATASLDHSCHMYSLATGEELAAFQLPVPLRCLAVDPGEHALYAGGGDGRVFEVSLLHGGNAGAKGGALPGTGGGTSRHVALEGHPAAVTALAMTADGSQLVSGSEDGSVRIWDAQTRQTLRVLASPAKGPISALLVLGQPPHMAAVTRRSGGGGAATAGPQRPTPLEHLARYPAEPQPWEGTLSVVDGSQPYRGIAAAAGLLGPVSHDQQAGVPGDGLLPLQGAAISTAAPAAGGTSSNSQQQQELERLRAELAAEKERSRKWAALHAQLLPLLERTLPPQAAGAG